MRVSTGYQRGLRRFGKFCIERKTHTPPAAEVRARDCTRPLKRDPIHRKKWAPDKWYLLPDALIQVRPLPHLAACAHRRP